MNIWESDEACVEARKLAAFARSSSGLSFVFDAAMDRYARAVAVATLTDLLEWQTGGSSKCANRARRMLAELGGADD